MIGNKKITRKKHTKLINKTKINNFIYGVKDLLLMQNLKELFKTFFTLDYKNYITKDTYKRQNQLPILIEGYLAITLECKDNNKIYDSYMLKSLKLGVDSHGKYVDLYKIHQSTTSNHNINHMQSKKSRIIAKKLEIIKQSHTIIKYIAIILGHQLINAKADRHKCVNGYEIIKVQMHVNNDFSVILDKCYIKKDWNKNNLEDNNIQNWINSKFYKSIHNHHNYHKHASYKTKLRKKLTNQTSKSQNLLSAISLYNLDFTNQHKKYKKHDKPDKQLTARDYSRKDFTNNFIIVASNYIIKDRQIKGYDYSYLIKHLTKYGLEFLDFYSTIDTKPAFLWFDVHDPVNTDLIRGCSSCSRQGYSICS